VVGGNMKASFSIAKCSRFKLNENVPEKVSSNLNRRRSLSHCAFGKPLAADGSVAEGENPCAGRLLTCFLKLAPVMLGKVEAWWQTIPII